MKINFKALPKLTFSQWAGITVGCIVFSAGLLISILTWINLSTHLEKKFLHDTEQQLQRLAITVAPTILSKDRVSLNIFLNEWNRGNDIHSIQIFNNSYLLIAENGRSKAGAPEISREITQDNLAIGSLRASLNIQPIKDLTTFYLGIGIFISAIVAMLAGLLCGYLAEFFFAYLHRFADAAEEWQLKNTPLALPEPSFFPQLNRIHQSFEHLAEQQSKRNEIDRALGLFAGSSNLPGIACEYQTSALLFIEISNLKELQRFLPAEQLISTLDRYYWLLIQTAKLYDGQVERYAGNGAVLLFNSPVPDAVLEAVALHCLYAAKLFLGLIEQERLQHPKFNIDFKVSAHLGEILISSDSKNYGVQYDLTGDTLHWTSYLASTSELQTLLASQPFYELLKDNTAITWQEKNSIEDFRGAQQQTWQLMSINDKSKALINRQIERILNQP